MISQYFSISEFLRSETAARNDIDLSHPPEYVRKNIERLATLVLDPIRERLGKPIVVTSGWRPLALNRLVGGAPNSDHLQGLAADIHAVGATLDELGRTIRDLELEIPLRKCIAEFGQWIHVAVEPDGAVPRREFLTASRARGRTVYEKWNA